MPSIIEPDLDRLRDHVLRMGGEVEDMIRRAARGLIERDPELSEGVLADDDRIDALELEADRICIRVLALKGPEARDLRFVMTAARITPILERVADHACNIARESIELCRDPEVGFHLPVSRMGSVACDMLQAALNAFADSDSEKARALIRRDEELNSLHAKLQRDLMELMSRREGNAGQAARLMLVVKHFERIGDYVTDICEQIVFMKEARVIKHSPGGKI